MIDEIRLTLRGGNGGDGCVSFRREKYVARGGPDGGDGGDGGHVYLVADLSVNTFAPLRGRRYVAAGDGGHGKGKGMQGRRGQDVEIQVPVGTLVWEERGGQRRLLADLSRPGMRALVARGGRGGRGNRRFASATNRTPLLAEKGEPGQEVRLYLELKLLANVGIVGLPNAGKSTLLRMLTAARPQVASYPFTTKDPVLGVLERGGKSLVMVEVPGLVQGAHRGMGLGHEFLRHVERCQVLLHLVDGSLESPLAAYEQLNQELRLFKAELLEKPQVIVVNKMDIPEVEQRVQELERCFSPVGWPLFFISAATGQGLEPLVAKLFAMIEEVRLSQRREEVPGACQVMVARPRWQRLRVRRHDGMFYICSPSLERMAARIDPRDFQARLQLRQEMERRGIARALRQRGVKAGDRVCIGEVVLEW